jgi:hypothetical protein
MTAGTAVATVRDALGFPSSGAFTVLIGTEYLRVTAGAGTTSWTVTRGYASSTAASHLDGATVTYVADTYVRLDQVKTRLTITDTADDDRLLQLIDEVNGYLDGPAGIATPIRASTDTQRLYDGRDAMLERRMLYIRDGIQTLTLLELADSTGGTFLAETNFVLRPQSYDRLPGWPAQQVLLTENAASRFAAGYDNIRLTGTFGWADVPTDLADVAITLVVRMELAARSGQRDITGTDDQGSPLVSRYLAARDRVIIEAYKVGTRQPGVVIG